MEKTITERDKALLLILGIIVIVFAAVMIPQIVSEPIPIGGIYALIKANSELKDKVSAQTAENESKMYELINKGINPADVEIAARARKNLQQAIIETKQETAKIAVTTDTKGSYMTAKKWIEPTKYEDFVFGDSELFTSFRVKENKDAFEEGTIDFAESYLNVYVYDAKVLCETSDEREYVFDLVNVEDVDYLNNLAAIAVLNAQMIRRGSVFISSIEFKPESGDEDASITLPFTVLVPEGDSIGNYGVCECTNCGEPYYKVNYEAQLHDLPEGESVKCTKCDAILDGSTIG